MTDYGKYFPSRWLKPVDIDYGERLMRVDAVGPELVGMKKEEKLVATFQGTDKSLILNKTNADALADIAQSADINSWAGIDVLVFHKTVEVAGEAHDVIRLKAAAAEEVPV